MKINVNLLHDIGEEIDSSLIIYRKTFKRRLRQKLIANTDMVPFSPISLNEETGIQPPCWQSLGSSFNFPKIVHDNSLANYW